MTIEAVHWSRTNLSSSTATQLPPKSENADNLAELGTFCRKMGREARQGEVGVVIGDEYFAIRDFGEE
jgi:hypothetical protein